MVVIAICPVHVSKSRKISTLCTSDERKLQFRQFGSYYHSFFFPDPSHTFLQSVMVAPVRGNKTWCVRKGVYWSPSLWVHRSQVSMKLGPFSWCHVYHGMRSAIAIGKNWKKVKGTVVFGLTFFISIPKWHISFFWGFAPWSDFIESELIKIFGFHNKDLWVSHQFPKNCVIWSLSRVLHPDVSHF